MLLKCASSVHIFVRIREIFVHTLGNGGGIALHEICNTNSFKAEGNILPYSNSPKIFWYVFFKWSQLADEHIMKRAKTSPWSLLPQSTWKGNDMPLGLLDPKWTLYFLLPRLLLTYKISLVFSRLCFHDMKKKRRFWIIYIWRNITLVSFLTVYSVLRTFQELFGGYLCGDSWGWKHSDILIKSSYSEQRMLKVNFIVRYCLHYHRRHTFFLLYCPWCAKRNVIHFYLQQ